MMSAPLPRLPDETRVGAVRLEIADLARSLAYYREILGLRVLSRDAGHALLGTVADTWPLVELREQPGARPAPARGRLGLYHFAILLPDRAALGRFVRHLAARGERVGAADHLVSEALYLTDPDGLGIEVYADRPRAAWERAAGEIRMTTAPLDLAALARAGADTPWTGTPAGTVVGHVHLHVGDLPEASRFYHELLGLDRVVWSYPGALFLSAGGYHHHLGLNVWAGAHAARPAAGDARLVEWELVLPSRAALEAVTARCTAAGYPTVDGRVTDPWGTALRLVVASDRLGAGESSC